MLLRHTFPVALSEIACRIRNGDNISCCCIGNGISGWCCYWLLDRGSASELFSRVVDYAKEKEQRDRKHEGREIPSLRIECLATIC